MGSNVENNNHKKNNTFKKKEDYLHKIKLSFKHLFKYFFSVKGGLALTFFGAIFTVSTFIIDKFIDIEKLIKEKNLTYAYLCLIIISLLILILFISFIVISKGTKNSKENRKDINKHIFFPSFCTIFILFIIIYIFENIPNREQDVVLLLPNFENVDDTSEDGRILADKISNQLANRIIDSLKDDLITLFPQKIFEIKVDRINSVLTQEEICKIGKSRQDDFGIYGKFAKFYDKGKEVYHIKNFIPVIINTELKSILNDKDKTIFKIPLELANIIEQVCLPLNDFTILLTNIGLFKIAAYEKDDIKRNQIYDKIDRNFLKIKESRISSVLLPFVLGNRFYYSVYEKQYDNSLRDPNLKQLDSAKNYYQKTIRSFDDIEFRKFSIVGKSRIYFNLAATYHLKYFLNKNDSTSLDSAKISYSTAARLDSSLIYVYELVKCIEDKLEDLSMHNKKKSQIFHDNVLEHTERGNKLIKLISISTKSKGDKDNEINEIKEKIKRWQNELI
jgi:hypothetical protein